MPDNEVMIMSYLINDLIGKANFHNKQIQSDQDLYDEIEHGLKSGAMTRFAKTSGLTEERISTLIPINRKTLLRRKALGKLDPKESDRLIAIAKTYAHAMRVFGSKEKVNQWIQTDNIALGNKKPFDLLKNNLGCQMVDSVLYRIEYGIYS